MAMPDDVEDMLQVGDIVKVLDTNEKRSSLVHAQKSCRLLVTGRTPMSCAREQLMNLPVSLTVGLPMATLRFCRHGDAANEASKGQATHSRVL